MDNDPQRFAEFLAERKLKFTPQRRSIALAALNARDHFTAEDLLARVKKDVPRVGFMTVYRTLKHLVESGLVEELALKRGVSSYESVGGREHHDHLVCVECGKLGGVSSGPLEKSLKKAVESAGWVPSGPHFLKIHGLCPDCAP